MSDTADRPRGLTALANRYAPLVKWVSLGVIALSVLLLFRNLSLLLLFRKVPLLQVLESLKGWIDGLGFWGPLIYGLIYVVAVVFLAPAWVLTVAAAVIFDFPTALVTVSLSSTTGAALAFLVSRYLMRQRVTVLARKYPKFQAVDRAISEGGWKIVALLRLSPAIPFNLQNYLYGLTGIRFWPYVLTSWLAMLPGTFLYVYIGYLSGQSLEAALSGKHERTVGEWVMLVVALIATVAVTVYITHLARRALAQHTDLAGESAPAQEEAPKGWPWAATVTALLAILFLGAAGFTYFREDVVKGWLSSRAEAPMRRAYHSKEKVRE